MWFSCMPLPSPRAAQCFEQHATVARFTMHQLCATIDRWEADLGACAQVNKDQIITLLGMLPQVLEHHMELNVGRLDTYLKARAEVISYTEQKAAKVDDGGSAPVELDAFKDEGGSQRGCEGWQRES